MKPEDRQLLLQDLCARLPYEVQCEIGGLRHGPYTFTGNDVEDLIAGRMFKPYLRPMSSMTEEEKKEYIEYAGYEIEESVNGRHYEYYLKDFCGTPDNPLVNANGVDWLNKKMFDFRGLIPKNLALSTEEFNPYKH